MQQNLHNLETHQVKTLIAITLAITALIAGCGKSDPVTPPGGPKDVPPITVQDVKAANPVAPLPEMHSPDTTPGPKPGQANDHSSPEFKGGDAVKQK